MWIDRDMHTRGGNSRFYRFEQQAFVIHTGWSICSLCYRNKGDQHFSFVWNSKKKKTSYIRKEKGLQKHTHIGTGPLSSLHPLLSHQCSLVSDFRSYQPSEPLVCCADKGNKETPREENKEPQLEWSCATFLWWGNTAFVAGWIQVAIILCDLCRRDTDNFKI